MTIGPFKIGLCKSGAPMFVITRILLQQFSELMCMEVPQIRANGSVASLAPDRDLLIKTHYILSHFFLPRHEKSKKRNVRHVFTARSSRPLSS